MEGRGGVALQCDGPRNAAYEKLNGIEAHWLI